MNELRNLLLKFNEHHEKDWLTMKEHGELLRDIGRIIPKRDGLNDEEWVAITNPNLRLGILATAIGDQLRCVREGKIT